MRIAIFSDIYAPGSNGGIVSAIQAQKSELEKLGHEVFVFCPGFKTREKNVILVPSFKRLRVNGAIIAKGPVAIEAFILAKFPDFNFDIVHVEYEGSCSIAGIDLAKKFNIPLVQTMHGREDMAIQVNVPVGLRRIVAGALATMHGHYLPHVIPVKKDHYQAPTRTRAKMWELMINHAEQADVVTVPSDQIAQKFEHYGLTRPIMVTPSGVSDELVKTDFPERKLEDGDVLKMIWNSRVSKEKRIMPFLKALAELKRPYMVYIYGNGNMLRKAKRFAKRKQLKVKFFGEQPRERILERMKLAHLGVSASYNFDTQGIVLIEAEATGLPVMICDPQLVEVVPQGGLILTGDPSATAMQLALDGLEADKIEKMSKVMLKNRKNITQAVEIKKLLAAYELAKEERDKENKIVEDILKKAQVKAAKTAA